MTEYKPFTPRQIEVAQMAMRAGECAASFSRNNDMPIERVRMLYRVAERKLPPERLRRKVELDGCFERLQRDAESALSLQDHDNASVGAPARAAQRRRGGYDIR